MTKLVVSKTALLRASKEVLAGKAIVVNELLTEVVYKCPCNGSVVLMNKADCVGWLSVNRKMSNHTAVITEGKLTVNPSLLVSFPQGEHAHFWIRDNEIVLA